MLSCLVQSFRGNARRHKALAQIDRAIGVVSLDILRRKDPPVAI